MNINMTNIVGFYLNQSNNVESNYFYSYEFLRLLKCFQSLNLHERDSLIKTLKLDIKKDHFELNLELQMEILGNIAKS